MELTLESRRQQVGIVVINNTMTSKSSIGSLRGLKPYRVEWIGEPGATVASFESLNAAIAHIATLKLDQQHVVIHRGRVVWPDNVRREIDKRAGA
jgi:hypothetical protein